MARLSLAALVLVGALAGCGSDGPATGAGHRPTASAGPSCRDFRFDRHRWRTERAARAALAQGLVRCRTLAGLSPGRVLRLLGRPDSDFHEGYVTYTLATGADRRELVVAFDSSHRVDRVRITRV
ncbi:MAG: hypothetical protein ACR2NH_05495 [Solirubrobacteraceae bacterium]